MTVTPRFLHALGRDSDGNILPLAAVGLLVSAALVGGGVDMSRAYKAENRLQAACDAGVLAGRRAVSTNGFDDAAESQAQAYFGTNFDEGQMEARDTEFVATSTDDGNSVSGTARANVDALVMKVFGFSTIDIAVDCTASMGVGNSDITMVLDNTGSMADNAAGDSPGDGETSRLEDLQAAMRNFYDTVAASASGSNTRIRYAFVPYSSSVNVGQILLDTNPDFLVDAHAIQSRVWVRWTNPQADEPETTQTTPTYDKNWTRITAPSYTTQAACDLARPADTGFTNNGAADTEPGTATIDSATGQKIQPTVETQPQRSISYQCARSSGKYYVYRKYGYRDVITTTSTVWDPLLVRNDAGAAVDSLVYRQVTYDTSVYKTFAQVSILVGSSSSRPAWVSSTWPGCIEERQTIAASAFTFVPGSGITPEEALDLDIDMAPDASDDATRWAPMWPEAAYYRTAGVDHAFSGTKASSACPAEARLLAEMDQDEFYAYADSLRPAGNTYHDIGLLWGARFSSPEGIWEGSVNEEAANGGAVSRHMIFMTDGELMPSYTVQSLYGIERSDRRITGNGTSDQWNRHRSRFLAVCEAVKAKGLRLWVIAFGTGLTADLRTCASDNSSFGAADASQLNSAFQEIAHQVGELRVTQ